MQMENNQKIVSKINKLNKKFHKIQDQIQLLANIMNQQSIIAQNQQHQLQEIQPEIIIDDEPNASVEIILTSNTSNEQLQPEKPKDPKEEARKLISRFYNLIKKQMEVKKVSQIEALRHVHDKKKHQDDPYQNLFKGFQKVYFDEDLKCRACHISYQNEQLGLKHVLNEHFTDLSIYICVKCKMTYQKREFLEKHIIQEHTQQNKLQLHAIHFNNQNKSAQRMSPSNKPFVLQKQNQRLDLSQYRSQQQFQPIVSKVFVPNKQSPQPEEQKDLPIFNQIFINDETQQQGNKQEVDNLSNPKKNQQFKFKFVQVKKLEPTEKD